MPEATLQDIEQKISQLPYDDRIDLIERLVRGLRNPRSLQREEWDRQMAEMAADPEVQREIAAINAEFSVTEMDGLK